VPYRIYMDRMREMLMAHGMSAASATQTALGQAYQEMLAQASMLSYRNAFAILAGAIFLLSPLPFLMRLPTRNAKPDPEALAGH
jgi:DHA2 family multidrug resistance protein